MLRRTLCADMDDMLWLAVFTLWLGSPRVRRQVIRGIDDATVIADNGLDLVQLLVPRTLSPVPVRRSLARGWVEGVERIWPKWNATGMSLNRRCRTDGLPRHCVIWIWAHSSWADQLWLRAEGVPVVEVGGVESLGSLGSLVWVVVVV
jgi:hypothetical protein